MFHVLSSFCNALTWRNHWVPTLLFFVHSGEFLGEQMYNIIFRNKQIWKIAIMKRELRSSNGCAKVKNIFASEPNHEDSDSFNLIPSIIFNQIPKRSASIHCKDISRIRGLPKFNQKQLQEMKSAVDFLKKKVKVDEPSNQVLLSASQRSKSGGQMQNLNEYMHSPVILTNQPNAKHIGDVDQDDVKASFQFERFLNSPNIEQSSSYKQFSQKVGLELQKKTETQRKEQ